MLPAGIQVFERGWLSANNIVFTTGVRAVVDTGYWTHQAQTLALVEAALGGQALEVIVNTHLHSDHCGGNAALKGQYVDAKLIIPPGLSQYVQTWDNDALTYGPTGQHCPPFKFDALLRPGSELQLGELAWEVHAAPGHDTHSVILFEREQGVLISADALWENGFGVVFPELEGENAFKDVGQTLDLIESLRPNMVIPGHGSAFTDTFSALARARRRLQSFVEDPRKHATHAAKVLVKFKLLEWQQVSMPVLQQWIDATRYFQVVHSRHFSGESMATWIGRLIDDLVRGGAAARHGDLVLNQ